jgi:hypothetical protein
MALTSGTVWSVDTLKSSSVSRLQVAEVLFTMSGTYDQASNSSLVGVPTLIQNSRRNGKTVSLVAAMPGTPATKDSDPSAFMGLKTVAISSNDITFELTDGDFTTELAAAAIPAQDRPFMLLVAFTEADPGGGAIGA